MAAEKTNRISFQGEPGANSDTACRNMFPGMEPLPCPTFEDAFTAVENGKADLAKDFPFKLQKPADTPYGPYADGFDQHQHQFGPFGPIRAKIRELQEAAAAAAKK